MLALKFRTNKSPQRVARLATKWEELTTKQHIDTVTLLVGMAADPDMPDSEWLPNLMHILSGYTVAPEKWLEVSGEAWAEAEKMLKRGDILSSGPPAYDGPHLSRFDFDNVQHRCPKTYEDFIAMCNLGTLFGMADILKKEEEIGGYAVAVQLVAAFVQGKTGFDAPSLDGWVVGTEAMPARVCFPVGFFLRSLLVKRLQE